VSCDLSTSRETRTAQNSEATHAVLTAAGMKNAVLQDVTPCRLALLYPEREGLSSHCSWHRPLQRTKTTRWTSGILMADCWCIRSQIWRRCDFLNLPVMYRELADSFSDPITSTDWGPDCEFWWVTSLESAVTWLPAARVALTLEIMKAVWGRRYFCT
jgi:hypothetical protein